MMERVTSGEHTIAYGIFGSYALGRSKKDPNLGIVLPKDYTHGDLARRLHLQAREEPERRRSCSSTIFCPSAARRSSPTRPTSIRCATTSRRSDAQARHPAGRRQGAAGADRPDAAGKSRPDQAARLPVEVAAGEEGTVELRYAYPEARRDVGPDSEDLMPALADARLVRSSE